jgi:glutamate receptor, ionotropic, invertebrate
LFEQDADSGSGEASQLGLANVGGVSMVLIGGVLVASVICVFEFIWETRKLAREGGETLPKPAGGDERLSA